MPASSFLQERAEAGALVYSLQRLADELPDTQDVSQELSKILEKLRAPLTVAAMGAPASGHSAGLQSLFRLPELAATPADAPIRLIKHTRELPEEELPSMITEEILAIDSLLDYSILDVPLASAFPGMEEFCEELLPQLDLTLFFVSADDPWHVDAWQVLAQVNRLNPERFVLLLSHGEHLSPDNQVALMKYFQQTCIKKFGRELPALMLAGAGTLNQPGGEAEQDWASLKTVCAQLFEQEEHPRRKEFREAVMDTGGLADVLQERASAFFKELQNSDRQLLQFERSLVRVHRWLRQESSSMDESLRSEVGEVITRALPRMSARIVWPSLETLLAASPVAAEAMLEEVDDDLREVLVPILREQTAKIEQQLAEVWQQLDEQCPKEVMAQLPGSARIFPQLKDRQAALVSRFESDIHERSATGSAREQAAGYVRSVKVAAWQPVVATGVGLALLALLVLFSLWSIPALVSLVTVFGVAGWSFYQLGHVRRQAVQAFTRMLSAQCERILVSLRNGVGLFGEELLEELAKKLDVVETMNHNVLVDFEPNVERSQQLSIKLKRLLRKK
ncbi:MAG: hypothetical protein ACFCU3_00275 [Verrucomicrobiales bacterium]